MRTIDNKPTEPKRHTLDRIISKAGVGSRTEARSWIGSGRITVNGEKIQTPDVWVDPINDRVAIDGRPLAAKQNRYILLYKPKGYLTTYKDPQGRPTVYDLLTSVKEWIFPVGRLDLDTTGLLILTNDSQFGDYVSNPESKLPKTYLVKASQRLSDQQLDQLRTGVVLSDGPTRPAEVIRVRDSERYTFFEITITEGRNRQVRRMVEALDAEASAKVLKLVRVSIGPPSMAIRIGDLQIGHYRELTPEEVRALAPRFIAPGRKAPECRPADDEKASRATGIRSGGGRKDKKRGNKPFSPRP